MNLFAGDAVKPDYPASTVTTAAGQPRSGSATKRPWRNSIVALTAVVGTLASIGMSVAIQGWQAHVRELRFANLASHHLQAINAGLADATDLLYSLRAYFESRNQPVTRAEFESFSHSQRQRVPGLRDTAWAPFVAAADRDAFEAAVRASGQPQFQIIEPDAEGTMVRAKERARYFPILYSESNETTRPILGLDIAHESRRRQAIERALVTDEAAATPPVRLIIHMRRANGGMLSVIPVRHPNAGAGDPPAGIIIGAFETAAMFENILATKVRLAGLDMYVFDPDARGSDRLIYWHSTDGKPAPDEASLLATRHWQGTLELVDQRWGAILVSSNPSEDGAIDNAAAAVLVGGLLLTGLLVAYLWWSHRRTRQLERLTADLHQTTEELRRNGAALDHIARHDVLTGLANRMAFRDEVASGLRRARRGQAMAVLYLDLDRFKMVNDTLGHPAGDRLLCEVADRLRASVRETDSLTRLGGDEFAIAQTGNEQPAAAEALARRLIDTLSRPYEINGQWVAVGVSVGVTVAEREDTDVDDLLRRADLALYAAKREGRGTWRFFTNTMELDAHTRRGLEMDLRHALEHDELTLYYQPQVTLADERISGFEALLRWEHPDRGLILPGEFIRCAEETGLILPVSAWVLRTALRQSAAWPEDISVAINLSPRQIARDDLVETIEAALVESGQPGSRLELEITENALMEHHTAGHAALKRLQSLGVRIALDNFGTSYASLSYLRSFPFDRIKIDRSFVAGITESAQAAAILRAILQLAASLNIPSLAEGVETPAQLELLASLGCDAAQGFLFSPARAASAVPRILATWSPIRQAADMTVED